MRISDRSSDVCSSDLIGTEAVPGGLAGRLIGKAGHVDELIGLFRRHPAADHLDSVAGEEAQGVVAKAFAKRISPVRGSRIDSDFVEHSQIGRASGRERVCQYV